MNEWYSPPYWKQWGSSWGGNNYTGGTSASGTYGTYTTQGLTVVQPAPSKPKEPDEDPDIAWLRKRVNEVEEMSGVAA